METKVKKWMGVVPEVCDFCGEPLEDVFIDGRTQFGMAWGIMCVECHTYKGCGLGEGKGQKYDLKTLIKIGG